MTQPPSPAASPQQAQHDAQQQILQGDFQAALATLAPWRDTGQGSPMLRFLIGLALDRMGQSQAAIPHLRAGLAAPAAGAMAAELLGRALRNEGQTAEALRVLQDATTRHPGHPSLLAELGLIQIASDQESAGLASLAQAMEQAPGNLSIVWQATEAHLLAGRSGAALAGLYSILPDCADPDALAYPLGRALNANGQREEALAQFDICTRMNPESPAAWTLLGHTRELLDRTDAIEGFRRAAEAAPHRPDFTGRYATKLHQQGAHDEARALFARSMPQLDSPGRGGQARLRVAILTLPGSGNTPTSFLAQHPRHLAERVYLLDDYPYDFAKLRRSYDVLFSAAGDADRIQQELKHPFHVADSIGLPVVNPPRRVMHTARDSIARRLSGLPDAVVPKTLRLPAAQRTDGTAIGLAEQIGYPLLVRSAGSHGGVDITRIGHPAALQPAIDQLVPGDVYLTRFCDFIGKDGLYRKYRIVFVDGEMLPYHMFVNQDWLCHYARSLTSEMRYRREEAAFLRDPAAFLGPQTMTALSEINRRMDLDYFGVDFAQDQDGRLILFESNATMAIRLLDGEMNAYRRRYCLRIRNSFAAMLEERASAPVPPRDTPS